MRFTQEMLIAGGGIGGLAAALACARSGWRARIFEAVPVFDPVGAGIQLGPNATRLLQAWGLDEKLAEVTSAPGRLLVRQSTTNRVLATLQLGRRMQERYGAPYLTLHRADLHGLLLGAVAQHAEIMLTPGRRIVGASMLGDVVSAQAQGVPMRPLDDPAPPPGNVAADAAPAPPAVMVEGDALLGADGLWSTVRSQVVPHDTGPRDTGHFAYRALLRQDTLAPHLRSGDVNVWLGPGMHAVAYPVRGGQELNLVVLVQSPRTAGEPSAEALRNWNTRAVAAELDLAIGGCAAALRDLAAAAPEWRRWSLCDRPPLSAPEQLCAGRIALLGDAAHPMLPYLAQGAAMALEDADALGRALAMEFGSVPQRLRHYALNRWQRARRVQQRSLRNARIFHATGPVRWSRDMAMAALGERLLDLPWLYAGP